MGKEKIMSKATDPPSDERKSAGLSERVRGVSRVLVNRETLVVAIRFITLVTRIVDLLTRVFGGF